MKLATIILLVAVVVQPYLGDIDAGELYEEIKSQVGTAPDEVECDDNVARVVGDYDSAEKDTIRDIIDNWSE